MQEKNSPDTREQLLKMMKDTERDLQRFNRQRRQQEKQVENPKFYRSLSVDDTSTESLINSLLSEVDQLRRENDNLSSLLKEEKERAEKEEASLRKVADQKLVENNHAIPDLSDRNRPTQLGEMHSELFDYEWTDALDDLQSQGYDEKYAIATLFLTFVNVFDFCKHKAEAMLLKTEDALNFLFEEYKLMQETKVSVLKVPHETLKNLQTNKVLHERWRLISEKRDMSSSAGLMVEKSDADSSHMKVLCKETAESVVPVVQKVEKSDAVSNHIKVLRKETAESMVPVVQKVYIDSNWRDGEFVPALKPYIRRCIFLCWMMAVQSPPMCLDMVDVNIDVKFDKNMYKEYTVSGPMINYVVWPALLLHENGPLVGKGIAQGCKHRDNSSQ